MSKFDPKKTIWILPALFFLLLTGFIGFAIDNYQVNRELRELKESLKPTELTDAPVRSEKVSQLIRENYVTECKLKRSMEFYTVKNGTITPRPLLGQDRLDCVNEAYAMDDPVGGKELLAAAKAASDARIELFRKTFDMCLTSLPAGKSDPEKSITCVSIAYNKTLSVSY